ncbi:MAG: DHHW family protein, partial [Lachnospiraceae bacterium]|nr:DHHW family protein [Lachnospiraceae bacterium]
GNADETESKDDNGMEAPEFRKVTDDFLGTDYNRIHYYKKKDVIERAEIPEADNASAVINDSGDMTLMDSIYDDSALNTADKYNYFLSGNFSAITIKTACRDTEKKDKTLVLIKDSYSNSLVPFLCQDYGTIVMIDLRYANSSVFDYLNELESMDDLLIVYNYDKFMRDTHQYLLQ